MLYRFDRVRKSYGPKEVLKDVTWQHNPGQKVGLVGRNGAGKTTLLRIALGREEPDSGELVRANAIRIQTVDQALAQNALDETLHDYTAGAFAHLHSLESEMRKLEHAMADGDNSPAIHDRYDAISHRFENEGGYDMTKNDLPAIRRKIRKPGETIIGWWQVGDLKQIASIRVDGIELIRSRQASHECDPPVLAGVSSEDRRGNYRDG